MINFEINPSSVFGSHNFMMPSLNVVAIHATLLNVLRASFSKDLVCNSHRACLQACINASNFDPPAFSSVMGGFRQRIPILVIDDCRAGNGDYSSQESGSFRLVEMMVLI